VRKIMASAWRIAPCNAHGAAHGHDDHVAVAGGVVNHFTGLSPLPASKSA